MTITLPDVEFRKDGPTQFSTHSDGTGGRAVRPFALDKPRCASCGVKHVRGTPCGPLRILKGEWDETKHPRGQPGNKGEFGSGGGGASSTFTPLPRSAMPQLGGPPTPGTLSATLTANERGNVDLSQPFLDDLKSRGIKTTDSTARPSTLKPSQSELNPTTVDTLANTFEAGKFDEKPLWVSRDGYVIDGHHRWAAAKQDGDREIPIRTIDLPIGEALDAARQFASKWGLAQETVGESSASGKKSGPAKSPLDTMIDQAGKHGGFSISPTTGAAPAGGYMVAIQGHNVELAGITDLKDPEQRATVATAVRKFLTDNAEVFAANPHAYVGGWSDTATGEFTLDPSENIMDREQAVTLGGQRNQIAIWDVVKGEGIKTGGTGDRTEKGILKATDGWLQRRRDRPVGRGLYGSTGGGRFRSGGFISLDQLGAGVSKSTLPDAGAGDLRTLAGDVVRLRLTKAFNPDEARDESGKWSNDGDSGGGDSKSLRGQGRRDRDDAKDSRPTKQMKTLVRREGVKTVGDLQPGDVMTSTNMDGSKSYHTIEHVERSEVHFAGVSEQRVKMISRSPSGRMAIHSARPESILGAKNERGFADMGQYNTPGWNYIGSEPQPAWDAAPLSSGYGSIRRPVFRDKVFVTRPLVDNARASNEVAKAVSLVEDRARPGALDDLRITSISDPRMGASVYAQYLSDPNEPPAINVNPGFLVGGPLTLTGESARIMNYHAPSEAETVQRLGASYRTTVDSRFHPNRNGYSALTTITVHELGHHLHLSPQKRPGPNAQAMMARIDPDFNYFEFGAVGERGTVNETFNKTVAKTVSSYATSNIREFMAEAYSEGMLADRPRPIAKLVTKVLNGEEVGIGDVDAADAQWQKAKATVLGQLTRS